MCKEACDVKVGYGIQPNVFAKGLRIFHWGIIVTHSSARAGENRTIINSTCLEKRGGLLPESVATAS